MESVNTFNIAELGVKVIFDDISINNMNLLPSFEPFRTKEITGDPLFQIVVDDSVSPVNTDKCERIGAFDTGNGDTIVDRLENGGYQYTIKDIDGAECCLLQTDKDFKHCRCALKGNYNRRRFGLNNALMLVFAFAGSFHGVLLIHASLVRNNGYGYAFVAKSGTGKSTHTSLWLKHIPDSELMNDDNPIVRVIEGEAYIYGSPWSGKTPCYRQIKAPLGAITRIDRALKNSVERLSPTDAFASMLPSCSSMKWDKDIFNSICNIIINVISTTGMYVLHCLPDKEAAEVCHRMISK